MYEGRNLKTFQREDEKDKEKLKNFSVCKDGRLGLSGNLSFVKEEF